MTTQKSDRPWTTIDQHELVALIEKGVYTEGKALDIIERYERLAKILSHLPEKEETE